MEVAWNYWGRELFEKAVKEDKVIFLYLHEGDEDDRQAVVKETTQDKIIKDRLQSSFLPVFVNALERPDVAWRYNQGGLPSLVFLTPKGQIISGYAGTSLSGLSDFMEQVDHIYKMAAWGGRFSDVEIAPASVSFEEKRLYLIKYREQFLNSFQTLATKNLSFDPEVLEFCLKKYIKTDEPVLKQTLEKSLESLAEGESFDFLDGGFFTHQSQKNLIDNLGLARIYSNAGKVLGDDRFTHTAQKNVEFVDRWLYNFDTGSFYTSLSGEEDYYKLASRTGRLAYLEQHHQPKVDQTIYTGANARAADFYFGLGRGEAALKTLNLLLNSLRSSEGLFFHYQTLRSDSLRPGSGQAGQEAKNYYDWFLSDQVYLVKALLNPVLASSAMASDLKPKTMAQNVWSKVMDQFYDKGLGGFFDRQEGVEEWGLLKNKFKPVAENVEAIRILKELGYEEEARRSLVEIFWQNKTPALRLAPLATLLLEF